MDGAGQSRGQDEATNEGQKYAAERHQIAPPAVRSSALPRLIPRTSNSQRSPEG